MEILVVPGLAKSCLIGLDILNNHSKFRPLISSLREQIFASLNDSDLSLDLSDHPFQPDSFENNHPAPDDQTIFANLIQLSSSTAQDEIDHIRERILAELILISAESLKDLTPSDIVTHKIRVTNETPIRQKIRPIPFHAKEKFKSLLIEMLQNWLLSPSESDWRSPTNLVAKPDGGIRLTIDYKKLNAVTVKDAYPLPNISELYVLLSKAKIFSKFDLASGYYQIKLEPESRKYTAFGCEFGLFEFNVLSMGLTNAVATFARIMNELLKDFIGVFVLVYIDDILIYSASIEEHETHVKLVINVLAKHGFKVKLSKCDLIKTSVKFLGHVVSENGLQPNPELIAALYQTPIPKTFKQVKSFIGLATYYRKFIKNFGIIAAPLNSVKDTGKSIDWTNESQVAYDTLRDILASDLVLIIPNLEEPFILATDSCDYGMGSVLAQLRNDNERPVAYFSKSFTKTERNYSVSEKELFAIVASMEHFKHYLFGKKFTVYSDHRPLSWLLKCDKPAQRLARWLMRIEHFDFEIIYREGPKNGNADGLSRMPVDVNDEPDSPSVPSEEYNDDYIICLLSDQEESIPLVNDQLAKRQLEDQDIKWIFDLVSAYGNTKPTLNEQTSATRQAFMDIYDDLVIRENKLFKKATDTHGNKYFQFILPQAQLKQVLENLHCSKFSGHLGVDKTWQRINERFYYPHLRQLAKQFVVECESCQKVKSVQEPTAPLQPIRPIKPRQLVTTDITGPLPATARGNKYVLVVCDHFSKLVMVYTNLVSMPDQLASTVADKLINYFCVFGIPDAILSDRGTNFQAALVSELLDLLDIHRLRTTAFHSMGNGLVERYNRTLKDMLTAFINEQQNDWDKYLDQLTFAYNSATNATTNFSPFEVHFGEKPKVPIDLFYHIVQDQDELPENIPEIEIISAYVQELQERMTAIFQRVAKNRDHKMDLAKTRYDRKVVAAKFTVGDHVLIRDKTTKKGQNRKLAL